MYLGKNQNNSHLQFFLPLTWALGNIGGPSRVTFDLHVIEWTDVQLVASKPTAMAR